MDQPQNDLLMLSLTLPYALLVLSGVEVGSQSYSFSGGEVLGVAVGGGMFTKYIYCLNPASIETQASSKLLLGTTASNSK